MVQELVLDGENAVLGRISSFAAKNALKGNNIVIVNSDKVIILGSFLGIIERYKKRVGLGKGNPHKKPKISLMPSMLLKRTIRGMLAHKKSKGREALKRVMCYEGVPREYEDKEKITFNKKNIIKAMSLEQLNKLIKQR